MYRSVAPDAVERRLRDLQRHRGAYIVPGPDFIWSIDGYMKLEPFGIEIYAAVDAYSRYIIWTYVGISARTAVSVSHQYLTVVLMNERHPRFLRSDHGTETVMIAGAHHELHQAHDLDISLENCYIYGTSTENVRVESWWGQLSKGMVFRWRVSCKYLSLIPVKCLQAKQTYFYTLRDDGLFSKSSIPDQIALLAVYLPVIRFHIASFVRTWNIHNIRKQANRPHVVHGKPFMNYFYPGEEVRNHGQDADQAALQAMWEDVKDWGKNLPFIHTYFLPNII